MSYIHVRIDTDITTITASFANQQEWDAAVKAVKAGWECPPPNILYDNLNMGACSHAEIKLIAAYLRHNEINGITTFYSGDGTTTDTF